MRASKETYRKVAKECSSYEPIGTDRTLNGCSCDASEVSCVTCKHFDKDEYCRLNLYDQIIASRHIEE